MITQIAGKTIQKWLNDYPIIDKIVKTENVFWLNPDYSIYDNAIKKIQLGLRDIEDAEARLQRFAPFIASHFPETQKLNGLIESPTIHIPKMQKELENIFKLKIPGKLLLKLDSDLAIAGSIKARGGIYEVLKHTEDLALKNGFITIQDDYSKLADDEYKKFFSQYSIQVGSTGNLGMSIGIMSAKIGYKVIVHMSADAKQWKKDLLRSKGVIIKEYASDYGKAVEEGRKLSDSDPLSYFIDDEHSKNLFLGYSVAASRLETQLNEMDIIVDDDHPLFVYLPCGVGGGPGGVTFGLKTIFKDNVHCFFAEPTHSPCMLLGMVTDEHDRVSVQDFGIDNITEADGLAVGRASGFVGKIMKELISGIFTVQDDMLYVLLSMIHDTEHIKLEPSACAGIPGVVELLAKQSNIEYLKKHDLIEKLPNATHLPWATGGSMVPESVQIDYYNKGKALKKIFNL